MRLDEHLATLTAPLWDRASGHEYEAKLKELVANESLEPSAIEAMQLRRLSELLHHAYARVPYYREMFDGLGIHPDDILTLDDYSRLPLLDRDTLRERADDLKATGLEDTRITRISSSGSTGHPASILVSREFEDWGWATFLRNRQWIGHRQGRREFWFARPSEKTWSRRLGLLVRRWRVAGVVDRSKDSVARWVDDMQRFKPSFIYGYPTAVSAAAAYILENGIRVDGVNQVMTSSELLRDDQRDVIARAFRAPVFNQYGATECAAIASECRAGHMHINTDISVIEFVQTGAKGTDDTTGEVVVTPLLARVMPLLRYRLGDLAEPVPGRCECGLPFPMMRFTAGRVAEIITFGDGHMVSSLTFTRVARDIPGVSRFQFRQTSPDSLELLVVPAASADGALHEGLTHVEDKFEQVIGFRTRITSRVVDDIPLTASGKHRYVVPLEARDEH